MYTIAASKIDSYHSFVTGQYGDLDTIIQYVMGIKKYTKALDIGTCVDAYLNDLLAGTDTYPKLRDKTGIFIHDDGIQELERWADQFREHHPKFVVQPEHKHIYQTKHGDLQVSMKLDILCPDLIIDNKTSKSNLNYNYYLNKFQGFLYQDSLGIGEMHYHHFKVSHATYRVKHEGVVKQLPASPGYVMEVLNNFMGFCLRHDLLFYLDRPDVYTMDSYLFGAKHFYKTVAQVLKDDPQYIKWMSSTGYQFNEEIICQIK